MHAVLGLCLAELTCVVAPSFRHVVPYVGGPAHDPGCVRDGSVRAVGGEQQH